MPPIGRFLRNLLDRAIPRNNEAPMYSFHLPENPSADQVRKIIAVIGHAAGAEVMTAVAAALNPGRVMAGGHDVTDRMPLTSAELTRQRTDTVVPPPPPPPPAAPEFDSTGMPWDARIHSGAKAKNKDGSWRFKKNLDDTSKMTVTAELRALYPAATPPAPPPASAAPVAPPPPTPAAPPPPAAPGAADLSTFAGVMTKLSGMLASGKVVKEQAQQAAAACGVPNTIALATRPDLWATFGAYLDAYAAGG